MKQDLRITKTQLALRQAMIELLHQKSFRKITVNDICREALTSRATFYAHFEDKYALLRYTMSCLRQELMAQGEGDQLIRNYIEYMYDHKAMFRHLLEDEGMLELTRMLDLMLAGNISPVMAGNHVMPPLNSRQEILIQYAVGGFIQLFHWLVRQNFRPDPDDMVDQLIRLRAMFVKEFRFFKK